MFYENLLFATVYVIVIQITVILLLSQSVSLRTVIIVAGTDKAS